MPESLIAAALRSQEPPKVVEPIVPRTEKNVAVSALQAMSAGTHLVSRFSNYNGGNDALAIAPSGKWLASESRYGVVSIYDPFTLTTHAELEGHTGAVNAIDFSPDGKLIATASRDNTVRIWRVASGTQLFIFKDAGAVSSLRFNGNGTLLTCSDQITIWNTSTGNKVGAIVTKNNINPKTKIPEHVSGFVLSQDGKTMATNGSTIRLWDLSTRKE